MKKQERRETESAQPDARPDVGRDAVSDGAGMAAVASQYGMQYVESVRDDMLDASLVADLPVEWARSYSLLPVRIGSRICVLTCDPSCVSGQEHLGLLIGEQLDPVLAPRSEIARAIDRCYYSKEDSPGDFLRELELPDAGADEIRGNSSDLFQVAEKAPITQLVNLIVLEALKRRASDIHIEPFNDRLRVRYRIDGILYDQAAPPKRIEESLVSRLKVMGRMDIAEKRLPQDGVARVRLGDREIDIRVSSVPVAEGERVVLRLLDRNSALLPLADLGLGNQTLGVFSEILQCDNGIVLVCGPTGSGKTTTLYAALGMIDSARKNVMTIEDPIEYQLPDIGQIQAKPKIGFTFAEGLRHILRQDPDVILVGETRDLETAEIAIRASLTGHLVFTTLHTNDAPRAILRLVDMGVKPYLVASSLRAALAQRLVRRLCPECRRETDADRSDLRILGDAGKRLDGAHIWSPGPGCGKCLEGYRGRTGLFELMVPDDEIYDLIRGGEAGGESIRVLARRKGMRTLADDGMDKALAGITSLDEVIGAIR